MAFRRSPVRSRSGPPTSAHDPGGGAHHSVALKCTSNATVGLPAVNELRLASQRAHVSTAKGIHPYKELTEGVMLTSEDAAVLWTVFVTPTDQFSEMRSTRLSGSADLILATDDPGGACRARDEARG